MFTVEPLHRRVDDVLGAGPVDVGCVAVLAENPVCENEIEGNLSASPRSEARVCAEGGGFLTELEANGGLGGERDGVAGDPPRAALRVLRRERPRAHGDVDPVHRRPPRVEGTPPGRSGGAVC